MSKNKFMICCIMISLNRYNAIILLLSISDNTNVTCIPEENKLSKINDKLKLQVTNKLIKLILIILILCFGKINYNNTIHRVSFYKISC